MVSPSLCVMGKGMNEISFSRPSASNTVEKYMNAGYTVSGAVTLKNG